MDSAQQTVHEKSRSTWMVRNNFRLRASFFAIIFVGLAMHLRYRQAGILEWALLVFQFLVYPHLLYWRARRAADPKNAELNHLLLDLFVVGLWSGALHFPLWPSFGMWLGCTLNITTTIGWTGALRSLFAFVVGVAVAITAFGFSYQPETTVITNALSVLGLSVYVLLVGNIARERNQQLRAAREQLREGEKALHAGNERLQQQLAENQALHEQLKELALRDPMTGLFNRRYLGTIVPHELARCARDHVPLCLMMMDIDHFKSVNDTYGHQGGDEVLRGLAVLLLGSVRSSDVACRYGGEEFLLLLPNMPPDIAVGRAEQWRAAFEATSVPFGGANIRATVSIGIAGYPEEGSSPEELIRCADLALYRAKAQGRNCVVLYTDDMTAET